MNIEREDHGSGNNFVRRHRSRDGYLADFPVLSDDYYFAVAEAILLNIEPILAMVGPQSSPPTTCLEDSTAHCLRSRRHDGPAAYQAGAEHIPGRAVIQLTAVNAIGQPEMAPRTANVGFPEGSSGHPLPRCLSAHCAVRDSKRSSTS
jgi:hypothetical protein